ncbi:DUF4376 domain-containing protein [Jiella endophytica]|uniref:DUF4376 domain-containing protein n=1 Tax=Jiella endophytica TaxID=2558362 RepID=A0A4Y8REQ1_9HYPH|nr:DUF4376 domain-containing protein [Jiella endophytica]TFF20554.1 DUF4376 domain-containing protein [Jiella endophytica]
MPEIFLDDTIPPVTGEQVNAERDRRINSGVIFNGKHYQTGQDDRENIAGKSLAAFMAIVGGAQPGDIYWSGKKDAAGTPIPFVWIATDNSYNPMDAQTMVAFGTAVADRKELLIFRASAMKKQNPIPLDYKSDVHWPEGLDP